MIIAKAKVRRATKLVAGMALSASLALAACDKGGKGGKGTTSAELPSTSASASADASSAAPTTSASPLSPDAGARAVAAPTRLPADLNVILISVDSLRADMPWAGYPRDIAPNLTALEKKSVSFTHAYSVSSYTSMSLGGLLAGRYPSELKRDGFFFGTYAKENLFFPEILQDKGVHTLSAHAHGYFKDAGFQQGFDAWELVPNLKWNNTTDENVTGEAHEKIAERMLSAAMARSPRADASAAADAKQGSRFFAWFHFLDPHDIYMGHEQDGIPAFGTKPRDRYDAEVVYTDQKLGKLLAFIEAAPWASHTAVIVTADHGETFGEHKMFLHGFEVWEPLVRVPLFFYVPGVPAKRLDTDVSCIDLAPTILEMMGTEKDAAMEGRSLVSAILSGKEPDARDVVVDLPATSDNDRRRALIFGRKKIISFGELGTLHAFDLAQDPGEEHPLTSGADFDTLAEKYKNASLAIKETPPYACGKSCLNRAYLNQGSK